MQRPREILVEDADALAACCRALADEPVVGLDTEFVGEHRYHPELCLVQVAAPRTIWLIDPFAFEHLNDFWEVLAAPQRTVVVHAGREEMRMCSLAIGRTPPGVFDLQIAAGLIGLGYPLSHAALVYQLLGIKLHKRETLTEWRARPLSKDQIKYAYDDVRHLLSLWEKVAEKLHALGRADWLKEEGVRLHGETPTEEEAVDVGDRWRKLKGAGTLDRRRLALLRALFLWREQTALKANRPARTILRDDLLVELARRNPRSVDDLHMVRGLPKRHAEALFQAAQAARQLSTEELPETIERDSDPPQVPPITAVLWAMLSDFCTRHEISPNLLVTASDLKALIRSRLFHRPLPASCLLGRSWRAEFVLPSLLEFLEGKKSLRIRDLAAETPFQVK